MYIRVKTEGIKGDKIIHENKKREQERERDTHTEKQTFIIFQKILIFHFLPSVSLFTII